jgi:hypothetical protein
MVAFLIAVFAVQVGGVNTSVRESQVKCEPGFWCSGGIKRMCPSGRAYTLCFCVFVFHLFPRDFLSECDACCCQEPTVAFMGFLPRSAPAPVLPGTIAQLHLFAPHKYLVQGVSS